MLCLSGFELYSRWVPLFNDHLKKETVPLNLLQAMHALKFNTAKQVKQSIIHVC